MKSGEGGVGSRGAPPLTTSLCFGRSFRMPSSSVEGQPLPLLCKTWRRRPQGHQPACARQLCNYQEEKQGSPQEQQARSEPCRGVAAVTSDVCKQFVPI